MCENQHRRRRRHDLEHIQKPNNHPLFWIGVGAITATLAIKGKSGRVAWFGIGAFIATMLAKHGEHKKSGHRHWKLHMLKSELYDIIDHSPKSPKVNDREAASREELQHADTLQELEHSNATLERRIEALSRSVEQLNDRLNPPRPSSQPFSTCESEYPPYAVEGEEPLYML